jgi:hypothetical protein
MFSCHSNAPIKSDSDLHRLDSYNCDSLIQILVKTSNLKSQPWFEIRTQERRNDTLLLNVFDTNGKGDTIINRYLVLFIMKNELIDVTLGSPIHLTFDQRIMDLIKSKCLVNDK